MYIFTSEIKVPCGCCLGGFGDYAINNLNKGGSLHVNGFGFKASGDSRFTEVCSIDALYAGDLVMRQANPMSRRIFTASHTHFAPMLDAAKKNLGRHSPDMVASFERAIEQATRESIEPNQCLIFRGEVKLPIYRRFDFPPSFVNNVLSRYAGMFPNEAHEVDRGVYIFLFRNGSTNLFTITYHACHPVTRHDVKAVSADYVDAIRRGVLKRFGTSYCLFFLGCAGDIRPNFTKKRLAWFPKNRFNWRFKYPPSDMDQDEADHQYLDAVHTASPIASFSVNSSDFSYKLRTINVDGIGNISVPEVHIGDHVIFSFFPFEMSHRFHLAAPLAETRPLKFIVSCSNHTLGYLPYPNQLSFGGYEVDSSRRYMGLKNRLLLKMTY